MSDSSGSALNVTTGNVVAVLTQKVKSIPLLEGVLLGKALKTDGIAGLSKTIKLKLLFKNVTEKDIIRIEGELKLFDDAGKEIGAVQFHSEKWIKRQVEIKTTS